MPSLLVSHSLVSRILLVLVLVQCVLLSSCSITPQPLEKKRPLKSNEYEVFGKVYQIMPSNLGYLEIGIASWYGKKFHGRLTAMGETYDMYAMTAAHKELPLPTVVKVTNLDNGRSVVLRVNDRGPFHDDRLIDLSYGAARQLGFENQGTAPVVVEALDEVNHPELVKAPPADPGTYYLQVGAYRSKSGAEKVLSDVMAVLPEGTGARVLTSETEVSLLYKVWVGPMASLEEENIAARITANNLGNPLRVLVEH